MKVLLLITFLCILNTNVLALKCFYCSVNENDVDKRCITDPATLPGSNIIDCNKNYCTTMRVEFLDPKGKVASMNRDCLDKPTHLNQVIEDPTFRTYYTSCLTDLCNGGTGKDTSKGGLIGDKGDEIVLLVPGTGVTNSASLFSSWACLVISAIIFVHLN